MCSCDHSISELLKKVRTRDLVFLGRYLALNVYVWIWIVNQLVFYFFFTFFSRGMDFSEKIIARKWQSFSQTIKCFAQIVQQTIPIFSDFSMSKVVKVNPPATTTDVHKVLEHKNPRAKFQNICVIGCQDLDEGNHVCSCGRRRHIQFIFFNWWVWAWNILASGTLLLRWRVKKYFASLAYGSNWLPCFFSDCMGQICNKQVTMVTFGVKCIQFNFNTLNYCISQSRMKKSTFDVGTASESDQIMLALLINSRGWNTALWEGASSRQVGVLFSQVV